MFVVMTCVIVTCMIVVQVVDFNIMVFSSELAVALGSRLSS